jgi:hypothetical protein
MVSGSREIGPPGSRHWAGCPHKATYMYQICQNGDAEKDDTVSLKLTGNIQMKEWGVLTLRVRRSNKRTCEW